MLKEYLVNDNLVLNNFIFNISFIPFFFLFFLSLIISQKYKLNNNKTTKHLSITV